LPFKSIQRYNKKHVIQHISDRFFIVVIDGIDKAAEELSLKHGTKK